MDIHTARQELRTRTIYDLTMRVTFYARVSSEKDEQLNSLENQISYYSDLIRKNPRWTYVEGYIDEGLSAATTKKRESFHRMVEDGKAGKFDFIITKEITRFARNTLDSIQFTRELLGAGVGVFFQNDAINTLDEDSELRLTIMSGIAQDELRKLSSRVKFGHAQAIKKGVVLGNSRIFGYRKDAGRLVIDESQAPLVRELFQLYATGQYSLRQLEQTLWEQGWRNHRGGRLSHTTLSGVIANPKYKGFYVGNKVKVMDLFTKKQKFLPPEEWVMYRDETGQTVPAIVPEALWERANRVLAARSQDVKARRGICNHANLLTGKLRCAHCGAPYYRRDSVDRQGRKNSKWVCSGKLKNGAGSCPSRPIYEEEIKPLLLEVFQETGDGAEAYLEEYLSLYAARCREDGGEERIRELRETIELVRRKQSKLLTYNIEGQITDGDFLTMNRDCDRELEAAEAELQALEQSRVTGAELDAHLAAVRQVLQEARRDAARGLITRGFVESYIDSILVTPEPDGSLRLDIRILTGGETQKLLKKLTGGAGRTGHTFKKMIEAYENGLK